MIYYGNIGLRAALGNTPTMPTTPTIITATREDIRQAREVLETMARERKKTPAWIYALIAFGIGAFIMRKRGS